MNITGKVVAVMLPRTGISKSSGTEWMAQEYVIETIDDRPRKFVFDVFGKDRIQEFNIQYGELIKVHFEISASQWQNRWYNSVRAWRIERFTNQPNAGEAAPQPASQQYAQQPAPQPQYAQQPAPQPQYAQQPAPQQQYAQQYAPQPAQQPALQPVQQNLYGDMPF